MVVNSRNIGIVVQLRPLAIAVTLAFGGTAALHALSAPVVDDARHAHALTQRQAKTAGLNDSRSTRTRDLVRGGNSLPVASCADDGSAGTLRSVLQSAGEGDIIDMSQLTCSTITLVQGPLDIGVFGDNHVYQLNFIGPGRDQLTIDGNGATSIFEHQAFSSSQSALSISDLTIANGSGSGGLASCINESGALTLTRVDVRDCQASGGAPLFAAAVTASDLIMQSSTITGAVGTATSGSETGVVLGAVYADSAELVDSTISGNTITSVSGGNGTSYFTAGGGLYVRGDVTLQNSTISGNSASTGTGDAALGGGLFATGFVEIVDSTLSGNTVDGDGGGVFKARFSPYGDPPNGTTLTIANSTISGNSASRGGGVSSARPATVRNSTIAFNEGTSGAGGMVFLPALVNSAAFEFQSTIIAGNTGGGGVLPADLGSAGELAVTGADNLIVDAGELAIPPDTLSDDPMLEPLAANGGATLTHALAEGSPAIDAGNNVAELAFDQRGEGFPRVAGIAADIGAFERGIDDTIFRNGFELPPPDGVTYQYDDGDGDTNQGPPSSFDPDMLWGNYYLTEPGGEIITEISVAFGPTFPSLAMGQVTFWLLEDPDMDFDPRNATSLTSVQGTPDVFNDNFFTVKIGPTQVNGAFFVAASAKLLGGEDKPARVDTDAGGDKSWFFYAPEIADVIDDLASAPFGARMDDTQFVIFPGAFMIRATGEPAN